MGMDEMYEDAQGSFPWMPAADYAATKDGHLPSVTRNDATDFAQMVATKLKHPGWDIDFGTGRDSNGMFIRVPGIPAGSGKELIPQNYTPRSPRTTNADPFAGKG